MKIVFSSKCLSYEQPGHPESPVRVRSTHELLQVSFDIVEPVDIEDRQILSVHTPQLVTCVRDGLFFDADTPNFPGIFDLAKLSAASAVTAAEYALNGENAFSLMRPPGHHACKDSLGGFCYFNNIAIATAHALTKVDKVAICDFDCHHGNGTQDIFLGDQRVLYISTHESPLYPGTGLKSDRNCLNYPLPAGTDETAYLPVFAGAIGEVQRFGPDVIAVSAGFDSFRADPLTSMCLDIETYEKIGQAIRQLNKPIFAVLEGGYSSQLKECVLSFLKGIKG